MFVLENKTYLWLLWIIPAVVVLFILTRLWRKRIQKKFAQASSLKQLSPDRSRFKPVLKLVLFSLALACFILALVNPKIGTGTKTVKRAGVDVVFALDVSKSMLAEDIAPNRLEKSKRIIQQIIKSLHGDRVGIIGYAGSAFPQLPITTDYGSARLFLNAMNTNMVSSQGTAIGEAINLSLEYYDKEQTSRVLVLVTDGEDHGGHLKAIAQQAKEKNIHIITIGIGTTKGGRIPVKENGRVQHFLKDIQGETVITKLNEQTLKKIADLADGTYIYGRDTKAVVNKVDEFIDGLEKTEFKSKQFASYESQFQWFLGLGILFVILDIFLLERKTKWVKKLNLFNENDRDDG